MGDLGKRTLLSLGGGTRIKGRIKAEESEKKGNGRGSGQTFAQQEPTNFPEDLEERDKKWTEY